MIKKNIIGVFAFIIVFQSWGQITQIENLNSDSKTSYLKARVKQLNEFIERFNGDYSKLDGNINLYDRKSKLKFLIDYQYYMEDSLLLDAFIESVVKDSFIVHLSDYNCYAELDCSFKYKKSDEKVLLFMNYYTDSINRSKWLLRGANLLFLSDEDVKRDSTIFINPVNNETNFTEFSQMFQSKYVYSLTNDNFQTDHLSVFLFLLKNKLLTFNQVNSVKYIFYTSKYRFEVSNINRESYNAGWLISKVEKNNLPFPIISQSDLFRYNQEQRDKRIIEIIKNPNLIK